jgi:hypothetical protein
MKLTALNLLAIIALAVLVVVGFGSGPALADSQDDAPADATVTATAEAEATAEQSDDTEPERVPRPDELVVVSGADGGADGFTLPEDARGAPWGGLLWSLVAIAVVLAPVFVSARRSHLD